MNSSLAKFLDVNTSLFFLNTQFYFSHSSLLLHKSHIRRHLHVDHDSLVGIVFSVGDPLTVLS